MDAPERNKRWRVGNGYADFAKALAAAARVDLSEDEYAELVAAEQDGFADDPSAAAQSRAAELAQEDEEYQEFQRIDAAARQLEDQIKALSQAPDGATAKEKEELAAIVARGLDRLGFSDLEAGEAALLALRKKRDEIDGAIMTRAQGDDAKIDAQRRKFEAAEQVWDRVRGVVDGGPQKGEDLRSTARTKIYEQDVGASIRAVAEFYKYVEHSEIMVKKFLRDRLRAIVVPFVHRDLKYTTAEKSEVKADDAAILKNIAQADYEDAARQLNRLADRVAELLDGVDSRVLLARVSEAAADDNQERLTVTCWDCKRAKVDYKPALKTDAQVDKVTQWLGDYEAHAFYSDIDFKKGEPHARDRHTVDGIWANRARGVLTDHPTLVAIFNDEAAFEKAKKSAPLERERWIKDGGQWSAQVDNVVFYGEPLGSVMSIFTFFPLKQIEHKKVDVTAWLDLPERDFRANIAKR